MLKERKAKNYLLELGSYHSIFAAQSCDKEILKRASSGGVMTLIGLYLLENNFVDGVVVTGISYGNEGPRPFGYIANNKKMLMEAQGSKYTPSPTMSILNEIISKPGKYVVVGTPCQIAGLEKARKINSVLDESIYLTITNFCGGFRDYIEKLNH